MEKLTWLASERRMSQEGESEEENSQEENSEPEEEEEEEAEGMETLQKEDEVNDEAVGDAAKKPPSTLASPQTAPEIETSIAPAGKCSSSPSCIAQRQSVECTLSPGASLPSPDRREPPLCRALNPHQHPVYTRLPLFFPWFLPLVCLRLRAVWPSCSSFNFSSVVFR